MKIYLPALFLMFVSISTPLFSKATTTSTGGYLDVFEHSATVAEYEVRGWAYNPNHPGNSVAVDVYIDGRLVKVVTLEATRSDVIAFTGVNNVYGFVYELPTNAFTCSGSCPTTHEIQFVSRDLSTGETFELANGTQIVNHTDIGVIGSVDRVSLENAQNPEIFVRGWATTESGLPLDVYVMVDGQLAGQSSTDTVVARTDVNSAFNLGQGYVGYAIPVADNRESSSDNGMTILVYTFNGNTNTFTLIGAEYYLFEN